MKIDRRSFLSFIVGGAAGTALSPLPWKLMDDSSIWSQTWPWTPVPPDGEVSYVDSVCTLCPGACGISVRKIDDRAVKIEGQKGYPVNDGGLCILGLAGLQLLYGPVRVKTPLQKIDGRWQKISWEKAIALVADKLAQLREANAPHTVAAIADSDRGTVPALINRFLEVYGSPNFIRTPSIQDAYEMTLYRTQGVRATAGFDFENADFVMSFGSGLIEGWGSPVRMFQANSRWKSSRAKVVQIEPRQSKTAANASEWVPINPGTYGALALGFAHVILTEELVSSSLTGQYSTGFEAWKQQVLSSYNPVLVSQMTGVNKSVIVRLAREFASAARPLAVCGLGKGVLPGDLDEFLAVHALNALVGNINRPGGVWAVPEPDYISWPDPERDRVAAEGLQQARLDGAGQSPFIDTRYLLNRLPQAINSSAESPVKLLFVSGENPCYSLPDSEAVKQAFDKIDMVVSFSSYMDETAALADLILPNHVYLERFEDVPYAAGLPIPIVGLAKPVVPPQFNTRHTGDVMIEISRAMGGNIAAAFPWEDYLSCLEETLSPRWEELLEKSFWVDGSFRPANWSNAFETDSGNFEFPDPAISDGSLFKAQIPAGDISQFPLLLIPYDTMRLSSGYIGSPPFLVKALEDTVLEKDDVMVEINPATAKGLRLSQGDRAIVTTPNGEAAVRVDVTEAIRPGIIALPRGLGHTAYDKFLADKGVNVNRLLKPMEDGLTGLDTAWGIRAKLAKA